MKNIKSFEEFMEYSLKKYLQNKSEYEVALVDLDNTYYTLEVNRVKRKLQYITSISDEELINLRKKTLAFDLVAYKSRLTFVLNNHAIRMEFWKKLHEWKSPDKSYDDFIIDLEQELLFSEREYRERDDLLDKVKYLEKEISNYERNPIHNVETYRSLTTYKAKEELACILRQPTEEKLRRYKTVKQIENMVKSLNSYLF